MVCSFLEVGFLGGWGRASPLTLPCLSFEQNSVRHSKLYLTVRYCVNGYYFWLCIYSFINTSFLTNKAIVYNYLYNWAFMTFHLILVGSCHILSWVPLWWLLSRKCLLYV